MTVRDISKDFDDVRRWVAEGVIFRLALGVNENVRVGVVVKFAVLLYVELSARIRSLVRTNRFASTSRNRLGPHVAVIDGCFSSLWELCMTPVKRSMRSIMTADAPRRGDDEVKRST